MNSREAPPRLTYHVTEAAHALGISRSKLYQLIRAGEVAKTRIGGRSVVLANELERYLRHCADESAKKADQSAINSRRFSRASPLR